MKIVVDTSILIDYLRGGKIWEEFLKGVPRNAELFLPTIVIFELFSGKSSKKDNVTQDILNLINKLIHRELTDSIAQRAGELYRDIGSHIDAEDYIIAATAFELGATVLTLNKKHFEQISNLSIYPLEFDRRGRN